MYRKDAGAGVQANQPKHKLRRTAVDETASLLRVHPCSTLPCRLIDASLEAQPEMLAELEAAALEAAAKTQGQTSAGV